MGVFDKLFGTYQDKELKKYEKIKDKILSLESEVQQLTDDELKNKTVEFKEQLQAGDTLDNLLPVAYAVCREASYRVLGMKQYPVQIIGGIAIHNGNIAEMATGEGKTLMETLPAYLNALTGKGVHIVTVNEYLAERDCLEMGQIFKFLGLSVGLIKSGMSFEDRQKAYNKDITYATNSELGFDYLKDNMMLNKESKVQRGLNYCIVDEIDSILIDDAKTPLIIAINKDEDLQDCIRADKFAKSLTCQKVIETKTGEGKSIDDQVDGDYLFEEKSRVVTLTSRGIKKAEQWFRCGSIADESNISLLAKINQAIKANSCMERDKDYIVLDGEVQIIDPGTGRILKGRRYADGLHQAIEAKEGVNIQADTRTHAQITYQSFFGLYKKLQGMTGTASTSEDEFREFYGLSIVKIPTNKPVKRIDHDDNVYLTKQAKYKAIIEQINKCKTKGQPVLIGTTSVAKSEELQKILKANRIPHKVLNAKYHDKEAKIIAQAGRFGAVTIATNMAGRGTDIKLGGDYEQVAAEDIELNNRFKQIIETASGNEETDREIQKDIIKTTQTWIRMFSDPIEKEKLASVPGLIEKEFGSIEKYSKALEEYYTAIEKAKIAVNQEKILVSGAGGLYVLGTERAENRRIDNQLRGRSGRQGDPGESKFFLALDDDLIRIFGGDQMKKISMSAGLSGDDNIQNRVIQTLIEKGQKAVEQRNYESRKNMFSFDDVMSKQREIIYSQRDDVLNSNDMKTVALGIIHKTIVEQVEQYCPGEVYEDWNLAGLRTYMLGWLIYNGERNNKSENLTKDEIEKILYARAKSTLDEMEQRIGHEASEERIRKVILQCVDNQWIIQLENMEALKKGIQLVQYGQKDPVVEYRIQGFELFDEMTSMIGEMVQKILLMQKA